MTLIRPAEAKDLSCLVELLRALFYIEEDFHFNSSLQSRGLEMMLANQQGCVLVAEHNSQVVGMCTGQILISTAEGGPAALVEDVVVTQEYRKLGIGKLLMKGISKWAKTKKASRLQLLADNNNEIALNFYESIGWKKTQLICLRSTT